MNYLIDGHNLIPKLPGLSLQSIDDEMGLVKMLQEYCRRSRNEVEVYFDNAPVGQAGERRHGSVSAHFVPQGRIADDAIRLRLSKLGRASRNWSVVSSDQRVQREARAVHARVVPSEQFARELVAVLGRASSAEKHADARLSPEEVAAWMKLFSDHSEKPKKGD